VEGDNGVFSGIASYGGDVVGAGKGGGHPTFPGDLTGLVEIVDLLGGVGVGVPAREGVVADVVEVVFGGCGEEVAELEVVETTFVVEVCVAEFVKVVDSGWIVGLEYQELFKKRRAEKGGKYGVD